MYVSFEQIRQLTLLLVRHRPCFAKLQNSFGLVKKFQAGEAGTNVTFLAKVDKLDPAGRI